jgi:hypothetical protein
MYTILICISYSLLLSTLLHDIYIYIYIYIYIVTTIALEREQNTTPSRGERKQKVVHDHYK